MMVRLLTEALDRDIQQLACARELMRIRPVGAAEQRVAVANEGLHAGPFRDSARWDAAAV